MPGALCPFQEGGGLPSSGPATSGMERPLKEGTATKVFEENVSEQTVSKAMHQPIKPTKQMIEDHEVSHIPFRDWCSACVRGRAKACQHRRVQKDEALTTYSVDYGFFGSPGEAPLQSVADKDLPVLVGEDRKSKTIHAHPVPHKGLQKEGNVDEYPVKCMCRDLDLLGYKRLNLKGDQENALQAVCKATKIKWKNELVLEKSPIGESQSNGEIE